KAEQLTRQLATERDVTAAFNEVQVRRKEGVDQADDPYLWAQTLKTARSALLRAEGLLASGEPTDELRAKVAAAAAELDRDERDCAFLAELDRIADENDMRFVIPVQITRATSRRFAAAFRAYGMDLATTPHDEAVAWLRGHRFRDRLTAAVGNWRVSLSFFDDLGPLDLLPGVAAAA